MFDFLKIFGGKSDSSSEQAHKRLKFDKWIQKLRT